MIAKGFCKYGMVLDWQPWDLGIFGGAANEIISLGASMAKIPLKRPVNRLYSTDSRWSRRLICPAYLSSMSIALLFWI